MISKLKKRLKHFLLQLSGKYSYLKKTANVQHQWYGNEYGGFFIYPALLNEQSVVYSFGIGEDISFDTTVIYKHNCKVFGFDPTPKSINWVQKAQPSKQFNFFPYGIDTKTGMVDFYLPKNPQHVSGSLVVQSNISINEKVSVQMKSLHDIVHELGHTQIDVLKMDIEGSEYDVLENILNTPIPIKQMLIEFHARFFDNGQQKTQHIVERMYQAGYRIFGVSTSFEEVSFIHQSAL